jgi:hypothetical protein
MRHTRRFDVQHPRLFTLEWLGTTLQRLTTRQVILRLLVVHLAIFLVVALLAGHLQDWAMTAVMEIILGMGIIWWAERRWPLDPLTTTLVAIDRHMTRLNTRWCGVHVRLLSPICTRQGQVLLPAGTVGTIVDVRRDPGAPFAVRFEGAAIPVVPLLDRLEIVPDTD